MKNINIITLQTPLPEVLSLLARDGHVVLHDALTVAQLTELRAAYDRQSAKYPAKHAWMKLWQEGYETTPELAVRQTDSLRRQLTGGIVWHQRAKAFPAYQLSEDKE